LILLLPFTTLLPVVATMPVRRLKDDVELRERLASAGHKSIGDYDYSAWANGACEALASVSAGRVAC
jgi:hypothetical protein